MKITNNQISISTLSLILLCICLSQQIQFIPQNKSALFNEKNNTMVSSQSSNNLFITLSKIFQLNNMHMSSQIQNCFKSIQKDSLNSLFTTILNKGMSTIKSSIKNFPTLFKLRVKQKISRQTITCLLSCNDINALKFKFGLVSENSLQSIMQKKFIQYGEQKYQQLQKMFQNLNNQFLQLKYNILGQLLNEYGHTIYGQSSQDNQWTIRVQNVETLTQYFGVSVSNGIIGAISSKYPLKLSQTVIGGAYDKIGRGRVDNIIQTFPVLNLDISCGGSYHNFIQQLNIKTGIMSASYSTSSCSIQYQYFAIKNLPFGFLTNIKVTSHIEGQISIKNIHQAPNYMNSIQKSYQNIDTSKGIFSIMHSKGTTKSGKLDICIASSFMISQSLENDSTIKIFHQDWDSNLHFNKLKKAFKKGQTFQLSIITSLITSQHHSDPQNQAIRIVIRGVSLGTQKITLMHKNQWQKLWQNDIIIEGNNVDQKNIRLMLYHFYAFLNSEKSYGLSPMGLSGLGYNGHIFWDMDLWMYPAILALKPSIGQILVNYRIQRLQAAKNNAFINGYKGSMYPWQSSKSGQQQTPIWALTGPLQHHISGCVSFAVWNYYQVTQDKEWLKQKGYQVIKSVAQFWESRVQLNQKDGLYHINNVVGADEWAQNINDDAFTNAVAIKSLQIANKVNKILEKQQNKKWKEISEKIVILKFNSTNVTKQHQTYNGENIKQADVNLLSYPLNSITDPSQILLDLKYYQTRIPDAGTPAMTFSIFTILYSRLKNVDKSYSFFKESHQQFLRKPFNVFAETKGGSNPYFMTGAGGVLQSVIFGFGGYNITDEGIKKIDTVIPKQWSSLTIKGFLNEN